VVPPSVAATAGITDDCESACILHVVRMEGPLCNR
jgi:hypothetical protein